MNDPQCALCPHPRTTHDSDGCAAAVTVDGWEYCCGCPITDLQIDDDGSVVTTDSERYQQLLNCKYAP